MMIMIFVLKLSPGQEIWDQQLNTAAFVKGSSTLPPTNSPKPSIPPTKSATPSISPSISPTNTPTISSNPSQFPSISSSPTISASPTQFCIDTPNWKDSWGDGCGVYEEYEHFCSNDYDWLAGDMGPATDNCCICGKEVSLKQVYKHIHLALAVDKYSNSNSTFFS